MDITFWVTEACNLKCTYCYVDKNSKTMKLETAIAACEMFKSKIDEAIYKKEKVHISFHGGEPLLNIGVISGILDWFKRYSSKSLSFALTTNGTIYDEDIFQFLIDNKVDLSLSMDGAKAVNDKNRKSQNEEFSVYDAALKTLNYLKIIKCPVRVRMTVNKSNASSLYDSFIHLSELEAPFLTFAFDIGDDWTSEDMELYYQNYCKIMDYLISKDETTAGYELYNMANEYFRNREFCDGGHSNFHVSAEGNLYPCMMAVGDDDFLLGNLENGIDPTAYEKFCEINKQEVEACSGCSFKKNCAGTVCKVINKRYTGNAMKPSAFACHQQDILYRIYKKYENLMSAFNV